MRQRGLPTVLRDDASAVAVHLERDHGVRETLALVVQEEQRVHERVTERVMERPVRVRDVEALAEQAADERLGGRPVSLEDERRLLRLVPRVRPRGLLPRPVLDRVVGEHAERRDDVFLEVLVLVDTPDDDEVRREVVQHAPGPGEPRHERLPMTAGRLEALIAPPLLPHRLRPSLGRAIAFGKVGVRQDASHDARHVLVPAGEQWHVSHAEAQNRSHDRSSSMTSVGERMVHSRPRDGKERLPWPHPRFRL